MNWGEEVSMLIVEQHDHILLTIFCGEVGIEEVRQWAESIRAACQKEQDIFLVTIPLHVISYPSKVSEIITAANIVRSSANHLTRFYVLRYNPIMTFVTSISTYVLGLRASTVEQASLDKLFCSLEQDAQVFPNLRTSLDAHRDKIETKVKEIGQGIETKPH
jgi:hypothetical protein